MTLRNRRQHAIKRYLTVSRVIAIGLLMVAGAAFYQAITAKTPNVSENARELFQFPSAKVGNTTIPAIDFHFSVTFTAEGSVSADNPVSVHVLVVSSSIPDFPKYYSGIAFTDATAANGTDPSVLMPLVWHYETNGSYVADGKLRWESSGPTWVILVPNAYLFPDPASIRYYLLATAPQVESTSPIYTIADSSHTPSLNGADTTLFFEWLATGFGALALQPILWVLLLKENRRRGRR